MLNSRRRQPEWMDEPDLDPALHRQALDGLRRINAISRSSAILWPKVRQLAEQLTPAPVRVLDIGSGGGDVAVSLARRASRRRLPISVTGADVSPLAVEYARQRAARQRVSNVEFILLDALRDPWPSGFHVVTCSLFLHHFADAEVVSLLRRMSDAAEALVLVNDLQRSKTDYLLVWLGCRLLTRSPVVHKDGPLSVASAFTADEFLNFAAQAGLVGATVSKHWPSRFLLSWRRS